MKRQVAVYSSQRHEEGLTRRCVCIYCRRQGLGEIIPRGQQAKRLLLPKGWQEGIIPITAKGRFSKVECFPLQSLWSPPGGNFAMGFLCGDCHSAALQEYIDMTPELKVIYSEALLNEFEHMSERLDRAGDERTVSRETGEYRGYHRARRAVRLLGRMIPTGGPRLDWKAALRDSTRASLKDSPKTKPTGVTRHLMTGDIGNPWNRKIDT